MEEKVVQTSLSLTEEEKNEITVESVKHFKDKNHVELEGTVVNRYDLPKVTLLTVLTNTGRDHNETSSVSVSVTGEKRTELGDIKKGSKVKVTGKLKPRMIVKDEVRSYEIVVSASSVIEAKSEMEEQFGLAGRVFTPSYNKVVLTGTVFKMTQVNRGLAKVIFKIDDGKSTYVETTLFAKNMKKLIPHILIGNRLCVIAEIQSGKKEVPVPVIKNVGKAAAEGGSEAVTDDVKPEVKVNYYRNVVILDLQEV